MTGLPAVAAALVTTLAVLMPRPAAAFRLMLPGPASITAEHGQPLGSYEVPLGPWEDGTLPTRHAEGPVQQTAWRIQSRTLTTMQILADLRGQLKAQGYTPIFQCDTADCGGFDFRYTTPVLPEPEMHVDLGDFRFLSAVRHGGDGAEYASLLVSRTAATGFVQVIHIGTPPPDGGLVAAPPQVEAATPAPASGPLPNDGAGPDTTTGGDFAAALQGDGAVVLEDLSFPSGSSDLEQGHYDSLASLADYLKAHPDATVALVGHTDDSGTLDGNIALSKRRAASVEDRLVSAYGIARSRMDAQGVGYLAPRATNLTEEGRKQNRRVEVMLTSTP